MCQFVDSFIKRLTVSSQLHRCRVGWGCRIHRRHLCRGVRLSQRVSWYDTKQFDGEASVMLELWLMWSTPLWPLLPCPLWPGVVAPDRVLSVGQIEQNCVLVLNWIVWDGTVFTFKLWNYTKLNCLKQNYFEI